MVINTQFSDFESFVERMEKQSGIKKQVQKCRFFLRKQIEMANFGCELGVLSSKCRASLNLSRPTRMIICPAAKQQDTKQENYEKVIIYMPRLPYRRL